MTKVLATGMDNPDAGLGRGEFRVSVRRLAALWNWSPAAAFRFLRLLEGSRMIWRVKHSAEHPAEQEAERAAIEIADFGVGDFDRYGFEIVVNVNSDRYCAKGIVLKPGEQFTLPSDSLHWSQACDEGAILSEFGSTITD